MKWKNLIPTNPSNTEFNTAWKIVTGYKLSKCEILKIHTGINCGFQIRTPVQLSMIGGFNYHTENPVLKDSNDLYYPGYGSGWGTDSNNVRYYKIDKETNLPYNWNKVKSIQTIRSFIIANKEYIGEKFNIQNEINEF